MSFSQIEDKSLPASFELMAKRSSTVIPEIMLDSVQVEMQISEDERLGIYNRYGVVQSVEIDLRKEGLKTTNGNTTIWRYEINCPDAVSLGVFFKNYELPDGAALYVYNKDKTIVRGGFTNKNNKKNNQLPLAAFEGKCLVLEYNEPADVAFQGSVVVGSVTKAYFDFINKSSKSESAYISVNCSAGDDWQREKHAVCKMYFHNSVNGYYCSGALINNVRKDGTPYFLTANHCINTNQIASTLITYFNYENSTCTSSDASSSQTLSGASVTATNSYSDFTLLELSENPPEEYEAYFAGWDATGDAGSGGACIHHPKGTPKCIAIENNAPVSYNHTNTWVDSDGNVLTTTEPNTHWRVLYETGTTLGGSSGSPFFNTEKRIIGQLHGGSSYDYFGKISVSWDYNSSDSKQLKAWLDPDNTGILTFGGTFFKPPTADFETDATVTCFSASISLSDNSSNIPIKWQWKIEPETFEFINNTTDTTQNPEVQFSKEGNYSVTLIVWNEYGSDTITVENLIAVYETLPVEFVDTDHEITLCGYELDDYKLTASGAEEYSFEFSNSNYFDYSVSGETVTFSLTEEALKYGDFDTYVKVIGTQGDCSAEDSVLFHVEMPINDNAQYAIGLNLGNNSDFNNRCGTDELNEPSPEASGCNEENNWCPPSSGISLVDNSLWFTFIAPYSQTLTIETKGIDTQIAVYDADSYSDLLSGKSAFYSLLAADDDGASDGTGSMIQNLKLSRGKLYWLQVDGKDGAEGDFSINLLSNNLEVYPNPSDGIYNITVSVYNDGIAELSVFNMTGQKVFLTSQSITSESNTFELDLSGLPSGIYILRVEIDDFVVSRKLILSK